MKSNNILSTTFITYFILNCTSRLKYDMGGKTHIHQNEIKTRMADELCSQQ